MVLWSCNIRSHMCCAFLLISITFPQINTVIKPIFVMCVWATVCQRTCVPLCLCLEGTKSLDGSLAIKSICLSSSGSRLMNTLLVWPLDLKETLSLSIWAWQFNLLFVFSASVPFLPFLSQAFALTLSCQFFFFLSFFFNHACSAPFCPPPTPPPPTGCFAVSGSVATGCKPEGQFLLSL